MNYVQEKTFHFHSSKKDAKMNIGDHLVTPRTGYTHHGLYIGNGEVIHYSGFADGFSNGEISIASLDEFAKGHEISVKDHFFRVYDGEESVKRAFQRLGEDWYNVLANNCEHFVTWCIYGFHSSSQINSAITAIAVGYSVLKESSGNEAQRQLIQAGASLLTDSLVQKEVGRQVTQAIVPSLVQSTVSVSAGTAVAVITSTSISSGTAGGAIVLAAATPAVPLVASVAVAAVVGYGVKKVFDWVWED